MEEKLKQIREWLGAGSVNIFGLPMSGKDTVGKRLAEDLNGRFLSSGDIIREVEAEKNSHLTDSGKLIPTNMFYDIVLPYFSREELRGRPLVLSSIGRWSGEEKEVMGAAERGGHPISAVVSLVLDEEEVLARWEAAKELGDRGERPDDMVLEVFQTRLLEFREKTVPVLEVYRELGLLVEVEAKGSREEVYERVVEKLVAFASGPGVAKA